LIDRLGARLGTDRVQRFVMSETHIPERSFGLLPTIHTPHKKVHSAPRNPPNTYSRGSLALAEPEELQTHDEQLTRPIMLLNRPEVVDVMAEIPEGPPLRFRWRKVTYEIMASEGPERISCEWWRDGRNAMSRDYYKVEDSTGRRFWIYRLGLYERETNHPRWYMHGMFP
ncbi:MAG: DNA polymerase Y family protein, partial [Rhizobiales bacterium]|nr:DNA polymerase Y family protein [Hyphomicrobiales bacterium]